MNERKYSYIENISGHKDSKGDAAPWVIKSHETDEIISSHSTEEEAKNHLKQMQYHKTSSLRCIKDIDQLLTKKYESSTQVLGWIQIVATVSVENQQLRGSLENIINPLLNERTTEEVTLLKPAIIEAAAKDFLVDVRNRLMCAADEDSLHIPDSLEFEDQETFLEYADVLFDLVLFHDE